MTHPVEVPFRVQRICVGVALAFAAVAWSLTLRPGFAYETHTFSSPLGASVWGLSLVSAAFFFAAQWRSLRSYAVINPLLAIVVNLVLSSIIFDLNIPLYLDTVGTAFIAIIYGPILGMGTGVLSLTLFSVSSPLLLAYLPPVIVAAYLIGWLARRGVFKRMISTLLAGYGVGIIAALLSAVATICSLDENAQRGPRELKNFYLLLVHEEGVANLLQALSSDPIDKAFTVLLVCLGIRFAPEPIRRLFDSPETHPAVERVLTEDRFSIELDPEPPRTLTDCLQRYL